MLKSTHRPASTIQQAQDALPSGWTQHSAPTGHQYYYNAHTKESTYTRPVEAPQQIPHLVSIPPPDPEVEFTQRQPRVSVPAAPPTSTHVQTQLETRVRRDPGMNDRPRTVHDIPGCAPWVLVKTKFGRRFVHNRQTKESLWKFPKHVMQGVMEFDMSRRKDVENKTLEAQQTRVHTSQQNDDRQNSPVQALNPSIYHSNELKSSRKSEEQPEGQSDEEYEEVEVTDDESDLEYATKRRKLSAASNEDAPVELGEADMAFQLAQFEEEYGQSEDATEGFANSDEATGWTDEDARMSFQSLLDDYGVDPFTTWDSLIEAGHIIEDERYTHVSNMRARREAFADWSTAKIQHLKEQKSRQARQNPRIPYLAFLQQHATPRLFWTEFRRKFKKEPELKGVDMTDKEREKLYREYINRVSKMSEDSLKSDLHALLRSIPASASWNKSTTTQDTLPAQLLADVCYVSLAVSLRDQIVRDYIATLPDAQDAMSADERARAKVQRAERERQIAALRSRQTQVEDARKRQLRDLSFERTRLQQGDEVLKRALDIGRAGLLADISGAGAEDSNSS